MSSGFGTDYLKKLSLTWQGPGLLLHDLRKPNDPVFEFVGHMKGKNTSTIYKPAFVDSGNSIVVAGPDSDVLTLYRYALMLSNFYCLVLQRARGSVKARWDSGPPTSLPKIIYYLSLTQSP
jgi:hypothetical protein